MNVAVVGMGLIGGSFARAFKEKTDAVVFGENRTRQVMEKAKLIGAIDDFLDDEKLSSCKLIIVALYPQRLIEWLCQHAHLINKDAIVIDTCGIKQEICEPCDKLAKQHGFTFIASHPMAGVEHSGFDYSKPNMFEGASMILVPPKGTPIEKVDELKKTVLELGFGKIVITDPEEHDRMIAYTSQLAHVVSSAYVQSPCALRHNGFSAGSYRDMTRVATLNEDMWTELFLDNNEMLAEVTDEFIEMLKKYRDAIKTKDAKTLREYLRNGRLRKEQADGKVLK